LIGHHIYCFTSYDYLKTKKPCKSEDLQGFSFCWYYS
jgi:hypothetical protein